MSIELVSITKNTRGKDSHPVTFNAIGKFVKRMVNKESEVEKDGKKEIVITPTEVDDFEYAGVLTDLNDALGLVNGDSQKLLDYFAKGFNDAAYKAESEKDELDPYVIGMDEEKANAVKRAIRALSKATGLGLIDAADVVKASTPAAA